MTNAPWLLVIILLALLAGTVTAWVWTSSGATNLEALKTGGSAVAFVFGADVTAFHFLS